MIKTLIIITDSASYSAEDTVENELKLYETIALNNENVGRILILEGHKIIKEKVFITIQDIYNTAISLN